jgi:hypothetical protein
MTTTINQQIAAARRTTKYKTLVSAQFNMGDRAALAIVAPGLVIPEVTVVEAVNPNVVNLTAAGFTPEEIAKILDEAETEAAAPEAPEAKVKLVTSKEKGDALVAERGLKFAKGRVYLTPDGAEAFVRVRKTGTPEIIQSSGAGRTAAVLFFKTDTGDVALQNLIDDPEA